MAGRQPARFYSHQDGPPAQGDVLLGAAARIVDVDNWGPLRWQVLDEYHAELAPAGEMFPALRVAAGRCVVMVTTHDCAFQVSPLLDPTTVEVAGEQVDQGLLMGGRVVGYLPVPPLVVNGTEIIPAAVVDLNYRTTLDRLAYVQRLSAISEEGRQQLRYALAKLDGLRTPTFEADLTAAVGQEVRAAKVDKRNPLVVTIVLADGSTLELLQRPGSPAAGPPTRSRRSVRS